MRNRRVRPFPALVALAVWAWLPADLASQTCPDAGTIKPQTTLQEAIKAISVNLTNLCAAVPTTPQVAAAAGAIPKANASPGVLDPTWTRKTRVVTVSSTPGEADFTTISAACAYVATQAPAVQTPWMILVYPGTVNVAGNYSYLESSPFTVPIETQIRGFASATGGTPATFSTATILRLACTTGTCMTLQGGDEIVDLTIRWLETPAAAVKVVEAVQGASTQAIGFYSVAFNVAPVSNAFAVDAFTNTNASSYFYTSGITMSGNALGRPLVQAAGGGFGVTVYGGRFKGSTSCPATMENTGAGTLSLYQGTRLDAACTVDLKNSGAGSVTSWPGVSYGVVSGTITNGAAFDAYGTSNPATCSPGQRFLNTTTPAQCSCVATNTWKCITIL